jgi:hypothetical protein
MDRNHIEQIYFQCFPSHIFLAILLDIYHAKAKIVKEMNKYYPDFRATEQNLTIIFATIQQYGSYPTPDNFTEEFED